MKSCRSEDHRALKAAPSARMRSAHHQLHGVLQNVPATRITLAFEPSGSTATYVDEHFGFAPKSERGAASVSIPQIPAQSASARDLRERSQFSNDSGLRPSSPPFPLASPKRLHYSRVSPAHTRGRFGRKYKNAY